MMPTKATMVEVALPTGRAFFLRSEGGRCEVAVMMNGEEPIDSGTLSYVFRVARTFPDVRISPAQPLVVHGTHVLIGETPTFRFNQLEPTALQAFVQEMSE